MATDSHVHVYITSENIYRQQTKNLTNDRPASGVMYRPTASYRLYAHIENRLLPYNLTSYMIHVCCTSILRLQTA